ncbi:retropepsin-like aspartic protease family protein [Rhabdochromatium marinum]|uniref:retropepsin-like aspartic protease family protein n=1 Tax=Rhabdochromatium marinum TaxID=48729 RepID=UPI00190874DD|nr:retropepsin-like aspartic protease [Rhabdochromatium marinum]MBK1647260.1 hypothetical protein [Rhabdochromatium marinum]
MLISSSGTRGARQRFLMLLLLIMMLGSGLSGAASVELSAELARLAQQHGFRIQGGEYLAEQRGRLIDGSLYQRLRTLLETFDYIIIQRPDGSVERVLILGIKMAGSGMPPTPVHVPVVPATPGFIELPTRRRGNQHLVRVELEGAGARRLGQELLIDTGADALVLPASMISQLGLSTAGLRQREVQTANGRAQARYGQLPAVWLNGQRVADIAVAFLDDAQLGRHGLLGMSLLGRFRMTIDDQAHRLLLESR